MKLLLVLFLVLVVPLGASAGGERFACNMKALTSGERARYAELTRTLLAAAQETSELPNGYAFRLPAATLAPAAEWVSLEHRCCPFFTFELEQKRVDGPLWLRITGSEGVKTFIRDEFGL